jgi:hypothetical protein
MSDEARLQIGEDISAGDFLGYNILTSRWTKSGGMSLQMFYTQAIAKQDGVTDEFIPCWMLGHTFESPIVFCDGIPGHEPTAGYTMQPTYDLGQPNILGDSVQRNGWRNPFLGYLLGDVANNGENQTIFVPDNPRSMLLDLADNSSTAVFLNNVWFDRLKDTLNRTIKFTGLSPDGTTFFGFRHQADLNNYFISVRMLLASANAGDLRLRVITYAGGAQIDDTTMSTVSIGANSIYNWLRFINLGTMVYEPEHFPITVSVQRDATAGADTTNGDLYISKATVLF